MNRNIHYAPLGAFINKVRIELNVKVGDLCEDAHISRAYYYELIKGKELKLNYYLRTFGRMLEKNCMNHQQRSIYLIQFFEIGMEIVTEGYGLDNDEKK